MGQLLQHYKPDRTLRYCAGGGGYVMNFKTLTILYNSLIPTMTDEIWSDVMMGKIARKNKVNIIDNDKFKSRTPAHYKFNDETIKNKISFHLHPIAKEKRGKYIFKDEMFKLYNIINNNE